MSYSIIDIANILQINTSNLKHYTISTLLTDSRQVFYAEESLFFALTTAYNDGHKYIIELYDLKVRNFVVSKIEPHWKNLADANFLLVDDTLKALQKISISHREHFSMPVVGITGSNGKTIVKEWLFQLLKNSFNIVRSPRSYNSQIGVPLSVWQINSTTTLGIFEAGISKPHEMEALEPIIQPTIGIFTSIDDNEHQENFHSLEEKCLEKLCLFKNSQVIICNADNEILVTCLKKKNLWDRCLTWTKQQNTTHQAFLTITNIHHEEQKTVIQYRIAQSEYKIQVPFTDFFLIENVLNVILAATYLKVPHHLITKEIQKIEPVDIRLEVRKAKNNSILISDKCGIDITSLEIALSFLQQRATNNALGRAVILSDTSQNTSYTKKIFQQISKLLTQYNIDKLIGIGEQILPHADIFTLQDKHFYSSLNQFIISKEWANIHDKVILLKAEKSFNLQHIHALIEERVHETFMEINLDALIYNFNIYKNILGKETKIVCMVKADAYGAGATEVAKTLQYHRCDYLAVATAEEGIQLRKDGIKLPILVLNPEVNGFEILYQYHLEPEVYNFRILHIFIQKAIEYNITNYPIHLKIDTGMHRLGFTSEDIDKLLEIINKQTTFRIKSIFSHLAASENWLFDDFTQQQISAFKTIADRIQEKCQYPVIKHILNSAGIERFPLQQLDMVRLGISLYGINVEKRTITKNVCSLYSTILQIKHISKHETVGYGRKGVFDRDAKIATIRIGYADGLSRQLGNGVGYVLIRGKKAPFVGNICMDLSMIDITGIDAKEGDIVEIFGDHISVTDIANKINTIPYEILTAVSSRVKRIYFKE